MGHSLGLGHSSEANSIMNPYYKDSQSQELGYDDILGMHSLYSKNYFYLFVLAFFYLRCTRYATIITVNIIILSLFL